MIVSGWTTLMAFNTDGNRRKSQTKSSRSATTNFGFEGTRRAQHVQVMPQHDEAASLRL
jgi:hypothetical protein